MSPEADPPDPAGPAQAVAAAAAPGAAPPAAAGEAPPAAAGGAPAVPGKRRRRGRRRGKGGAAKASARAAATGTEPGAAARPAAGKPARPARAVAGPATRAEAGDDHKLQKLLAEAGLGSRRDMEDAIVAGRVSVNGKTASLGQRITRRDVVKVDGRAVRLKNGREAPEVLIYHKPAGEIVSHDDPEARPTVFAGLPAPKSGRWVSVGRLDFNTEGLLILTNSGELANRLMHPRYEVEREYSVRVVGELTDAQTDALLDGVDLDDGPARFLKLEEGEFSDEGPGVNRWYRVMIREGRNREVRRMFDAVGAIVSRLIRTRFGPIALPRSLHRGQSRALSAAEVKELLKGAPTDKPTGFAPVVANAPQPGRTDMGDNRARRPARGRRTANAGQDPNGRPAGMARTRRGAGNRAGQPGPARAPGPPGRAAGPPGHAPGRGIGKKARKGAARGGLSRGELTLDGRRPAKPRRRYDDDMPAPAKPTPVIVRRRSRLKIVPPEDSGAA